jgi:hypothetical protein
LALLKAKSRASEGFLHSHCSFTPTLSEPHPNHTSTPQTDNFATKNHTHVQTYSLSSINAAAVPTEAELIKAILCRE